MQLLRLAVGPVWRDVVRRELKTEARCTVDVNRVPINLNLNRALQEAGPEGALGDACRLRCFPGWQRGRWRGKQGRAEALDRSVIAQRHVSDAGRLLADEFQR